MPDHIDPATANQQPPRPSGQSQAEPQAQPKPGILERRHPQAPLQGTGPRGGLAEQDIHGALDLYYRLYQEVPGQTALRAFMGTGSYGPIAAALRTWKERATQASELPVKEVVELPEALRVMVEEAVRDIATRMWQAAAEEEATKLAAERKILEAKVSDAEHHAKVMQGTADEVQEDYDKYRAEALKLQTAMQGTLDEAITRVEQLQADIARLNEELAKQAGRLEEVTAERDTARSENHQLTAHVSRLQAEMEASNKASEQRIAQAEQEALDATNRASGIEQRNHELEIEHASLQQAHASTTEQFRTATAQIERLQQDLAAATSKAAAVAATLEARDQEIALVRTEAAEARSAAKQSGEEAAAAKAKLSAVMEQMADLKPPQKK